MNAEKECNLYFWERSVVWTVSIRVAILLGVIFVALFFLIARNVDPEIMKRYWLLLWVLAIYCSPIVIVAALCGFIFWRPEWVRAGAKAGAIIAVVAIAIQLLGTRDLYPAQLFRWHEGDWIGFAVWIALLLGAWAAITFVGVAWLGERASK